MKKIAFLLVLVFMVTQVHSAVVYQRIIPASERATVNAWAAGLVNGPLADAVVNGTGSYSAKIITSAGWLGLGVVAGLVAYHYFWTASDLGAIKTAATPAGNPAYWSLNGSTSQYASTLPFQQGAFVCSGLSADWQLAGTYDTYSTGVVGSTYTHHVAGVGFSFSVLDPGGNYVNGDGGDEKFCHRSGLPGAPVFVPASSGTLTVQGVQGWLSVPGNKTNPLHPDQRLTPDGLGAPAPQTGTISNIFSLPQTAVQTQVQPSTSIPPGSVTVANDVPPPAGTVTTDVGTQTSTGTTTTTTATNPDGSTTTTTAETETATVGCAGAGHDQRTMGTVLSGHMQTWQSSGLMQSLSNLQNIVWPSVLPVFTFSSAMFGVHTLDLNTYAWVFTSLRLLMIGVATLATYRIIFG